MKLSSIRINFFTLFLILGIVAILLISVNCNIAQNEKNNELNALKNELYKVENEGARLEIEIESRADFFVVEEYASKELGMKKIENYQIQYIQYERTGTIELLNSEEDENFFGKIAKAFSVITDFFGS